MTAEEERIISYHRKISFLRDENKSLRELVMKLQESKPRGYAQPCQAVEARSETMEMER